MHPDSRVCNAHHGRTASAAPFRGRKVCRDDTLSVHPLAGVVDDDLTELSRRGLDTVDVAAPDILQNRLKAVLFGGQHLGTGRASLLSVSADVEAIRHEHVDSDLRAQLVGEVSRTVGEGFDDCCVGRTTRRSCVCRVRRARAEETRHKEDRYSKGGK